MKNLESTNPFDDTNDTDPGNPFIGSNATSGNNPFVDSNADYDDSLNPFTDGFSEGKTSTPVAEPPARPASARPPPTRQAKFTKLSAKSATLDPRDRKKTQEKSRTLGHTPRSADYRHSSPVRVGKAGGGAGKAGGGVDRPIYTGTPPSTPPDVHACLHSTTPPKLTRYVIT